MKHMRRTTAFIFCFIFLLLGLAFARISFFPYSILAVCFFAVSLIIIRRNRKALILTGCLLFFCGGWWRGTIVRQQLDIYNHYYGEQVVLIGTASDDAVYAKQGQLSFTLNKPAVINPSRHILVGQISVAGFGEHMVYRGDQVRVAGKLNPTIGSKQARMSFATLHTLAHPRSIIETLRHRFVAGIQSALPEPLGAFALGILIGQRSTLPKELVAILTIVGLTHVVAVSGYNLTILTETSKRFASKASRYQTVVFSIALVLIFLLLVGSSPSIIRAATVSILGILSWYFGRTIRPLLLILFVAAMTAFYNPLYLWSDAGWYLSFLAFFGVLILAPLIVQLRQKKSHRKPSAITLLIIETLCAQIMTIPITLFLFGQTSAIALVANLLVVPLVPLAMLLALLAGLSGMIVPALSGTVAWPSRILLTYMLDMATLLSHIPHVFIERTISKIALVVAYSIIMAISLLLWFKTRIKPGIITDQITEEDV